MSMRPPPIDRRHYEDIVRQTTELAQRHLPSWQPGSTADAGVALMRIFGRMAALVSDRLNRTPEKNFLAFLDLIGTQIRPPQPARVPLTFDLAAGSQVDAFVPAQTQVAALLPDGEEVVFETEQELVVTTAQITAAFVSDPDRDRLRDCTAQVLGKEDRAFPVFEGDRAVEHSFYFACDPLLTRPGQKTVTLSLQSPQAGDLSQFPITWSVWNGADWQPVLGIVEGLAVTIAPDQTLKISPGRAIDAQGNLIELSSEQALNLTRSDRDQTVGLTISLDSVKTNRKIGKRILPPGTLHQTAGSEIVLARLAVDREGQIQPTFEAIPGGGPTWEFTLTENLPTPAKQILNGVEAAWIRASLHHPLPIGSTQLPQLLGLEVQVKIERRDLGPDLCRFNTASIDFSKDFFPLGEQPRFNDTFYIASQDGLAQPDAEITLTIEPSQPPPLTVRPSGDLELVWEAWTGQTWQILKTDSSPESGQRFIQAADTVQLKLPETLAAIDVGGETNYWIRVRMLRGNYRTATPGTTVTSLRTAVEKSATLPVHDLRKLMPKDSIRIGVGATSEWGEIQTINSTDQSLTLQSALANSYPSGTSVLLTSELGAPSIKSLKLGYRYESKRLPAQVCAQNDFVFTTLTIAPPDRPSLAADAIQGSPLLKLRSLEGFSIDAAFILQDGNQPAAEVVEIAALDLDRALLILQQPLQRAYPPGSTLTPLFRPFMPCRDRRSSFYLKFDKPIANRLTALYFQVEPPLPNDVLDPSAMPVSLTAEYTSPKGWTRLGMQDETQTLSERGLMQFIAPPDWQRRSRFGSSGYWLRLRWEAGSFRLPPRLRRVLTNTMWASQTTTCSEILGSSSGDPNQTYVTRQSPVLWGLRLEVRESTVPPPDEQAALEAAIGAEPVTIERDDTGQVTAVWVRWQPVPDFYGSSGRDRHYVINYLTGTIRFGDGQAGRVPAAGRNNIRLHYQTGGGDRETLPPLTVNQLKTTIPFVDRVTNLEAGGGGAAQESLAAVQERGPKQLRHRGRAVTLQDFEDLAFEASADVARVKALAPEFNPLDDNLWIDPQSNSAERDITRHQAIRQAGQVGAVRLLIVPYSPARQPTPSLALIDRVTDYLQARCSATLNLQVMRPQWQEVVITTEIVPVSLQGSDGVRLQVLQRLEAFLHPLTGGPKGEGWRFGRAPRRSDLYAAIAAVPGVDHVQSLQISPSQDRLPADTLVFSGVHIVQLVMPSLGGESA